jgi:hypothetical protein
LANEKTPLRDTAPSTPQRALKSADRSTVARRRVLIGVVVGVAVIGGLYLLLNGGKDSPISLGGIFSSSPPVPEFSFSSVAVGVQPTVMKADKKKHLAAAKEVAPDVQGIVTQLFQTGYVDPETWGDAGAIEDLFTGDAQRQLEANIDTLTLGVDADATFASVQPEASKLKVTSLTDGNAKVIRAMAQPWFSAIAANDDGTFTEISVTGTLFLVQDGDEWKIEAFRLNREMKPGEAPVTSPSASASESA